MIMIIMNCILKIRMMIMIKLILVLMIVVEQ